jgi:hypothetical protein
VNTRRANSLALAFSLGFTVAYAVGCGGGAGGSSSTPPPTSPPAALTIVTPSPLPTAVWNQPYSLKFQATGGTAPYTWSLQGTIPGISLSADGTLSGAVAQQYTFIVSVTVTDSKGVTASESVELDTVGPLAFQTTSPLADQNIALPVSMYIAVVGGRQPYTFSLAAGSSMPPGLNFSNGNAVGLIQGTPTTPGKYSFTVRVSDSFSPPFQISQTFTMNVLNGIVVPNSTLPDAVQNVPYSEQIKVFGGTPPYQFALYPFSSTPSGLTLNTTTGVLSGTPATATQNTNTMYMYITDSAPTPVTAQAYISINVQPPLAFQTTSLPDSVRGLNYGGSLNILGGRAPYTVTVSSGALPDGLSLAKTPYSPYFNITGSPTKDGSFQFILKVSDSYETPNTATQSFTIRISDPLTLSGPGMAQILYGQNYSTTFPASGGFPPYTWAMDTIPPGFAFDTTTGTLSGTGTAGSWTAPNVSVQDSSNPPQIARYYSFVLDVYGKLTILPSLLPPVATDGNVLFGLPSTGGAAPLQWSLASGTLPPGLTFGTSGDIGLLSGSPSTAGSYTFTIGLSDGNTGNLHQTTSRQYTLVVKPPAQLARNDSPLEATPISTMSLLASISPYNDPSTAGPDVDYYSASAAPGTIVQLYVSPNNDFHQPPAPNSLQPILEVTDSTGTRYQTCAPPQTLPGQLYNLPCVNNLPGSATYIQSEYYSFQVPGSGTAPVTFYVRVSDQRGDARPDFIYTLSIYGVN